MKLRYQFATVYAVKVKMSCKWTSSTSNDAYMYMAPRLVTNGRDPICQNNDMGYKFGRLAQLDKPGVTYKKLHSSSEQRYATMTRFIKLNELYNK